MSYRLLLAAILQTFIKSGYLKGVSIFLKLFRIYSDFKFVKILDEVYKNNQTATILKIIRISKSCHGRFTLNYPKFVSRHSFHRKCDTILHLPF